MLLELIERGVKPASMIADDGNDHFCIYSWGKKGCGTTGCIGGWATLDPELRAQGLKNYNDLDLDYASDLTPVFEDDGGFTALGKFYELDTDTTNYIFGHHNNTLEHAVERITDVLQGRYETEGTL